MDWCQKIRAKGGRHLGHGGVFVEHRGGQSFSARRRNWRRVARNNAIVSSRLSLPYDREVQDFITADPLLTCRMALSLGLGRVDARDKARLPVYLAHTMGGGAESLPHGADRAPDLAEGRPSVVPPGRPAPHAGTLASHTPTGRVAVA